jgi:hypothetical protein
MDRRHLLASALGLALPAPAWASGGAAKDEDAKKDEKKGPGSGFVQLPLLTATVIRPNRRRGVLTVEVGLNIPDPKLYAYADLVLPRLRAAFAQTVQIYGAGLAPGELPKVEFLARELQQDADEVLGRKGARVLLGTVMLN